MPLLLPPLRVPWCTAKLVTSVRQLVVRGAAAGERARGRYLGVRSGQDPTIGLPTPASDRQQIRYRLPVTGCWTVYNGGVTPEISHSWGLAGQRYAYDLVVCDEDGRRCCVCVGRARRPDACYAWGQPVVAPAAGLVVSVQDGHRDCPWVGIVDPFAWSSLGNFVVIRHAEGEYSLLAHLQRGSVCVRPGQAVEAGQIVGPCGNSGHSTEPHLHFQVQDTRRFLLAASLPAQIDGWWRAVERVCLEHVPRGFLHRGERVCDRPSGGPAESDPEAVAG
jgi:hypothetical protein